MKRRFSRSHSPRPSPRASRTNSPGPSTAQDLEICAAYEGFLETSTTPRIVSRQDWVQSLRLLSLDGGQTDVFGSLSQLLILREIMRRLEYDLKRTNMRPSQWFDMIGGSGTGGLIAIMLGRLHMTVDQAIKAYIGLFSSFFSDVEAKPSHEGDRTKQLDSALENMIDSYVGGSNQRLMEKESGQCKVFICAVDPTNLEFPVLFRSYHVRSNASADCSVKEAARATTAIIGEYNPVTIGDDIKQEFVSSSHCYNNPTEFLLKEAKEAFQDRTVSCIVSIGSGHPGVTQISSSDDLAQGALRFARNSERVSEAVFRRLGDVPSLFYRLNVDQGMQWGLLHSGSKATSEVQAHTASYLRSSGTDKTVNDLVETLRNCEGRISANDLGNGLGGSTIFVEQKDAAEIRETTSKHYLKSLLKELQPVEQAIFNATSPVPRRACTENTRGEILDTFLAWALDKEDKKIYYLNGMAGTGKTTLAYTLCQLLEQMGLLGGTFFCSRADRSCSDANRIASTLAFHLARYSPEFCNELVSVLEENAGQPGHNVDLRFNNLIVKPLKAVAGSINRPVIIVIDALDERRSDSYVLTLIHNLWLHAYDLPIKFFVTSRPERPFHDRIYGQNEISTKFHLHNVESSLVERDIRLFLDERLRALANDYRIRGLPVPSIWPPESQLNALTRQSGKLFIYAATACQYIGGSKLDLSERLERVLGMGVRTSKVQTTPLDSLYTGVLDEAYKGCEENERNIMNQILRAVISAIAPLSVSSLAELLRMDIQTVATCLSLFHSVLNVPSDGSLVTALHTSFPDYLSNEDRSQRFHLDPAQSHSIVASFCLKLMQEKLKENICDHDGLLNNESIPDSLIERCVSPALAYACNHWPTRVRVSSSFEDINDTLRSLVTNFFDAWSLMWIECLSYLNALYHSIPLLRDLKRWIPKTAAKLASRIIDVRRFVSQNDELLSINALEIYNSALLWLPRTSFIRQKFGSGRILPNIVAGLSTSWDPCEMILTGHSDGVYAVAFSRDGTRIASGSYDGSVRIWNATTGELEHDLAGHSRAVMSVAFSPGGNRIASGSFDKTVRIWNANTGKSEHELVGHSGWVHSVAFSPDGARIASGSRDTIVRIWNATTGKLEHTSHYGVESMTFSPDGALIASGSSDKTVRIWNATTGESEHELTGYTVHSVTVSPDSSRAASGSSDKIVRIWNALTGESEHELNGHLDFVLSVSFSPDGALIASGSKDETVRIWNALTDGALVAPGSNDNTVRIWNATTGKPEHELTDHLDGVNSVAFSPDGSRIISGSNNNTVRIWNATTEHELTDHSDAVESIAFSPDDSRITSGSNESVRITNAITGVSERKLVGHSGNVASVAFSPDGARIVSSSYDSTVLIWNAATGELEHKLTGHSNTVESVTFSPDGSRVALGPWDKTVRIWNATTGESEHELTGHSSAVFSVAFSPDGLRIASGSWDNTVRIWNATTGESIYELTGHLDRHSSVAFSADGNQISARDYHGRLLEWDVTTGKLQQDSRRESDFSDFGPSSSALYLSEDRRWLIVPATSRQYWIPPAYAGFSGQWFHSNKAVFGYTTGKIVIITV